MPMSRYEIRNEYSLADPELYRAADKDDPEALLEGVAMAGLVGVLRQLGDLAEFAAEIFHDLHEEVVATAARGHNLMARVQQLESEVPFIEKSFLTQTDHSPFFYNAGVDWHPNVQINKNLVTQGDLPRFIMDSYEECRGPPRLFLLDKFDVAGAGACLKRYTDPSFFKVETPEITTTDIQREKKIRKTKKKGPRWRNGETPEVLPTSNAKLHQLFLKERVENAVSNPARRVKLKRRLNGFPFDSRAGKSYMEKFLKTPSPDHNVLSEVNMSSSLSMLPIDDRNEPGLEVTVVRPVSPNRERVWRKRSPPPGNEEILDVSIYEPNKVSRDDSIFEVPNSYPSIIVTGEKDISVNKEGKPDSNLTGYLSDDIASEIDNYVDAPSTMESEMDTDSETRVKRDFTSSLMKALPLVSDLKDEDLHTQSLESQSSEEPTMSDDGNNSSKKASSSFSSSGSPSSLTENPHLENKLSERFQSSHAHDTHLENTSSYQKTADEDFLLDRHPESVVSDHVSTTTVQMINHRSDFEQQSSSLCSIGSIPTSKHSDTEIFVSNETIRRPEDDIASASDDEERKNNLVIHTPSSPSVTDFTSQSEDDSPISFAEEHAVDRLDGKNITSLSESDNLCHMDSSVAISSDSLNEDDSNREDLNLVGGMSSSSSMCNVLSPKGNDTSVIVPTENIIRGNLDHEVPKIPENCFLDCPDIAQNGDNTASMVSKEQKKSDELNMEEPNVSIDSSSRFSYIMNSSHGKELDEASSVNAHNAYAEVPYSNSSINNQISSENLILIHVENSPDCKDLISEEETTLNENLLDPPKSCVVEGLHDLKVKDGLIPNDSATLENSCGTQENLEGSTGLLNAIENDGITLITRSIGAKVAENWGAADMKVMNEVHALQGESDSETDQLEIADKASTEPVVSDDAYTVSLHVDLDESVEDHTPCFEDLNMEFEKNHPSGSHKELGLLEEMGQMETATSGLDQVFCNPVDNGQLKPEVLDNSTNTNFDLGVEDNLDYGDASSIQSAMLKSVLDVEQETIQQNGLGIHVSGDPSLPISSNNEEKIFQENKSPPNQLELLDFNEISSGLSPLVPTTSQQMLDHDDNKCENKSAFMLSIVNSPSPHSLAYLPGLSSNGSDEPEYPNPPDSIFPPSNHFSETNHLNLDESPPLPPLPPAQWWKDKLQQVSPTTSSEAVSSSHADMNHSPVQYLPEIASKDEKLEHSLSSLETNSMYLTFQHQPTIENEPQQTTMPAKDVDSLAIEQNNSLIHLNLETVSEIDKVEYISSKLKSCAMDETIDLPPKRENELQKATPFNDGNSSSLEETNHSLIHINPDTASKEKRVQHSSSSLEANALHKANDHPPKIENDQQKIIMPFLVSEITSPAEEDGLLGRSPTVKLSRPRNPLIESVAALDKSKLRKVSERITPETQKTDEKNSILEQIRAKSFNLKPAIVSRPSIRGPRTNHSVAAILEKKANAIRQALAGSDEEDNWSDS